MDMERLAFFHLARPFSLTQPMGRPKAGLTVEDSNNDLYIRVVYKEWYRMGPHRIWAPLKLDSNLAVQVHVVAGQQCRKDYSYN